MHGQTSDVATALLTAARRLLQPEHPGGVAGLVAEEARGLLGGAAAVLCLADAPGGPIRPAAMVGAACPCAAHPTAAAGVCCGPDCICSPYAAAGPVARAPVGAGDGPGGCLCVVTAPGLSAAAGGQALLAGLADLAGRALAREQAWDGELHRGIAAERERLARELHDGVCQSLGYLYTQLRLLQGRPGRRQPGRVMAELGSLADVAGQAFDECRSCIGALRATPPPGPELAAEVARCARELSAGTGIPVDLDVAALRGLSLGAEVEAQLAGVVREALRNVAKHARASRVTVHAVVEDRALSLSIADDGAGMDPEQGTAGRRGFGLAIMRDRAASIGGWLDIQSAPGRGTAVRIRLPLAR